MLATDVLLNHLYQLKRGVFLTWIILLSPFEPVRTVMWLPQLLTVLKEYEMLVFGAVMIATMVFLPRGLLPSLVFLLKKKQT